MDRVFKSDVSDIAPQPPETPLIGYPKDGNPMTGTPATKPGEWWFHMMTEEMRNAILASGQTPDPKRVDQLADAIRSTGQHIANAGGTANDLTVDFIPSISALSNGLTVFVRAKEESTISTPTLKANGTPAKTIVKGDNLPLAAGDIAGAGHWLEMQYDSQLDKWVLQNPAKGITPQSGVPVGTIEYFAMETPPAGYLKADGATVGRETYPELFAAIGITFGEGDGSTTFNLPDLIDRFAQGSNTPGQKIEAGLPDIVGTVGFVSRPDVAENTGAFNLIDQTSGFFGGEYKLGSVSFNASRSNPIYGASETVQPPALTLLPCIKAFDAATNPGLIDVTELANEMAGKADRDLINTTPAQSFKDLCVSWLVPDYSAGISIPGLSTYTAPESGFIFVYVGSAYLQVVYFYINDVEIRYGIGNNNSSYQSSFATIPVKSGDIFRTSGQSQSDYQIKFFPCCGAI